MTRAPGPFLTLRPGGPFADALVAVSVAFDESLLLEASWKVNREPRSAAETASSYDDARKLVHEWADLLVIGREPE
jgi:hypothetical protein